ncbi:secreted protein/lipoprotein [Streptomyces violascens]|uniref:secreted protein/lipoprotein n=1 Tax=Streptomyces violascens TaxID=67381 RepID=UPI0036CEEE7A
MKTAAVDTYTSYWQQMQRAYAKASVDGTDIKKYAAAAALRQAEVDTQRMHKEGQVVTGQVVVGSPTVTQVDSAKKVPSATVSSCLDISQWKVVEGGTGKPVSLPTDRRLKYVIIGTIEKWPDGWKVIKDEPQDKPC